MLGGMAESPCTHMLTLQIAQLEAEPPSSHTVAAIGVDLHGDESNRHMMVEMALRGHAELIMARLRDCAARVLAEAPTIEIPPPDQRDVEVLIGGRLALKWQASDATTDEALGKMLEKVGRELVEHGRSFAMRRERLPQVATLIEGDPDAYTEGLGG